MVLLIVVLSLLWRSIYVYFCVFVWKCRRWCCCVSFFYFIFNSSPHRWIWSHHNFFRTCSFFALHHSQKFIVVLFFDRFFPLFNRKFFFHCFAFSPFFRLISHYFRSIGLCTWEQLFYWTYNSDWVKFEHFRTKKLNERVAGKKQQKENKWAILKRWNVCNS